VTPKLFGQRPPKAGDAGTKTAFPGMQAEPAAKIADLVAAATDAETNTDDLGQSE
jgi:hypothetical protein